MEKRKIQWIPVKRVTNTWEDSSRQAIVRQMWPVQTTFENVYAKIRLFKFKTFIYNGITFIYYANARLSCNMLPY